MKSFSLTSSRVREKDSFASRDPETVGSLAFPPVANLLCKVEQCKMKCVHIAPSLFKTNLTLNSNYKKIVENSFISNKLSLVHPIGTNPHFDKIYLNLTCSLCP